MSEQVARPRVSPPGRVYRPPLLPTGSDVCAVPAPLGDDPPHDRFCDLVMTGGVASGVVYPWAVVELARAFRFRNIGGTSVGAMAAVLAAAAEYGRCNGSEQPFEVLRRLPAALGEELPDGRTRMQSLFQTRPEGRRLIRLWFSIYKGMPEGSYGPNPPASRGEVPGSRIIGKFLRAYLPELLLGAFDGALIGVLCGEVGLAIVLALLGAVLMPVLALGLEFRKAVLGNLAGLCAGGTTEGPDRPGLVEWLHQGIQLSAGLSIDEDRPLSFRDLWNAPPHPGAPPVRCDAASPPGRRTINLQMITTGLSHGRPYRLPINDPTSRLFFLPSDLAPFLPERVLKALVDAGRPYQPKSGADPDPAKAPPGLLEMPDADMPIVVAARLSLSFPLLFSAVPLYAIDYDRRDPADRGFRRALFTDGGLSSNFPIHLFDSVLPRWPTFGLWLDRRGPHQDFDDDTPVWLPEQQDQGWGDGWDRFDDDAKRPGHLAQRIPVGGFLGALLSTAKDWQDRTSFRLPHVRNRVARLWLSPGEEGLHIGMPRWQILQMAARYGTTAGQLFVERFADGAPAWPEQRWVRLQLLLRGMQERLDCLRSSADYAAYAPTMREAIDEARRIAPLRGRRSGGRLGAAEAQATAALLEELERLELRLGELELSYRPTPLPELRLRTPL